MDNELLVTSIRELCKKHNISTSKLENDLNFGSGLISRWIKNTPSIDKIADIADYFHIPIDEVVGRKQVNSNDLEFIVRIMKQTSSGILQWYDLFSEDCHILDNGYKFSEEICNIENFNKLENHTKNTFVCECNEGYLTLQCWVIYCGNSIDKCSFSFFIQPSKDIKPVYQKFDHEQLFNLYKMIMVSLYGETLEMKADKFKENFIQPKKYSNETKMVNLSKNKTRLQHSMETYNIASRMNQLLENMVVIENPHNRNNDFRLLMNELKNPEIDNAINTIQRLIEFCRNIPDNK